MLRELGSRAPYADSRPLEIVQLGLGDPGDGELLVSVRAAGLCHSDLSVIDGSRPRVMPMVLGHEAAGVVVATGADCDEFAVGDHVALVFVPGCGSCRFCLAGRPALCEPAAAANTAGTLLSGKRRWVGAGDEIVHHHLGVSAFAEQIVVAKQSAVKIDPSVSFEIAALFGCAVLTGVGAVVNCSQVEAGQSVAVFGLGGVGLAALLGAVLAGASPIIAVDVVPAKLALSLELGATLAVAAGDDAVAEILDATGGGVDHAIETVGSEKVLASAYAATARGGTTVTVGLPHPSRMLSIPAVSLVIEERSLRGCYLGSCVPARDIPRYIDLYLQGRLPVERLMSHRLTLDELNEGFDRLASGEAIRQVVVAA
jgi:alcohol dehydrogenase